MPDFANQKTFGLFSNSASRKLVNEIENSNSELILFPPVEIEKVDLKESEIEYLENLSGFDWLIFKDVFAVDCFLENLEELAIDLFELDYLRICAVGESVADRLRFSSIHSDVIPKTIESDKILAELVGYIGENQLDELRFLFPKINSIDELSEKLKNSGASLTELPIYRVKETINSEITKLKTLLKGGAIDEFIFASPVDFAALKYYFKNERISDILAGIKISAVDSLSLQTAWEHNLTSASLFNFAKLDKVKK